MQRKKPAVEFEEGNTDILVIAPHAAKNDDDDTEALAFSMAAELECRSLINNRIKRGQGNYNEKEYATKDPDFMSDFRNTLDAPGPTLVVWIHGIAEENLPKEKEKLGLKPDDDLDCLIGYGQPDRFTALSEIVDRLCVILKERGISAYIAGDDSNYRGWSEDNMNQWCRRQEDYLDLGKVQSVQLEFRKNGLRSNTEEAEKTGETLAGAFDQLVRVEGLFNKNLPAEVKNIPKKAPKKDKKIDQELVTEKEADEALVSEAFEYLKNTFRQHFHEAMLEAGRYLIKMFYDDNYDFARQKKRVKKESLRQLVFKLQENSGNAPSKTWIYDAVKLAVDENDLKSFRLYGKMGHSQKVLLTHVKDKDQKRDLIEQAVENNYTVAELRKRIREENANLKKKSISMKEKISSDMLESLKPDKIQKLKDKIADLEEKIKEELAMHRKNLKTINRFLEEKVEASQAVKELPN